MTKRDKVLATRFDYIINNYIKVATNITQAFGFKTNTMVSNLRNSNHPATINVLHMDGLEKYFDIPVEVWEKLNMSEEEVDTCITEYQIIKKNKKIQEKQSSIAGCIFKPNPKVFEKLKGVWYAYLYPSNPISASKTEGLWIVRTTINDDYSVVDYWNNKGFLKIGKHESLILKESYDNDDLTVIRFCNRQIASEHFRFVIISNQNNTIHEMVNFGFFSRKKYTPQEAKEILGEMNRVQMKLDLDFNDRVNALGVVPH